jgi:PAS domain S-box-containing protein
MTKKVDTDGHVDPHRQVDFQAPSPSVAQHPSAEKLDRLLSSRIVFDQLPDYISALDQDMRILYLNRAPANRSLHEFVNRVVTDLMPKDHGERYAACFEAAWSSGEHKTLEYETVSSFSWATHFIPVREHGQTVLMIGATSDVTIYRRAERAYREATSYLEEVIEASGMGSWTWLVGQHSVSASERLKELLGISGQAEPLDYQNCLALISESDRDQVVAAAQKALTTGVFQDSTHRLVRADGSVRHVLLKGFVTLGDDGRAIGLRGGVFDVTERRRLEDELVQRQKMEAVGRLTAGIAHNFNNLLAVILPNIDLAREASGPALTQRLDHIEHATERAVEMIRDLMLFARRGRGTALRRAEDLVALAKRTAGIVRSTFGPAIAIELVEEGLLPLVHMHAGQIEQMLLNICLNARDALEEDKTQAPRITIELSQPSAASVRIRVVDNGPGMDETTRSRVFEPFFTTKSGARGTGLGLATAYAIIKEHGGTIHCESSPGTGAAFEIELPIATDGIVESRRAAASSVPSPRGERILVVDDEDAIRQVVRDILELSGFVVSEACDGIAGLEQLVNARPPFDLAIIDGAMPRLGGEALIAEVRARSLSTKIIAFTGHDAFAELEHADRVLAKPVSRDTLLEAVQRLLARKTPA